MALPAVLLLPRDAHGIGVVLAQAEGARVKLNHRITAQIASILLILSVFYCVTGIALLDYYMRKISLSILVKIIVYILFLPLGLIGYMGLCLCGVLDSFFDWRGINQQDEQLEKSII